MLPAYPGAKKVPPMPAPWHLVGVEDPVELTRILQLSITPVALISGVGLLLLSMTNRLGRVIDRSRAVAQKLAASPAPPEAEGSEDHAELRILSRRARLLQISIALIATSVFLSVLMVAALFAMHYLETSLHNAILALFGACLLCLASSIGFFLGDIFLSIRWLQLSLGRYVRRGEKA